MTIKRLLVAAIFVLQYGMVCGQDAIRPIFKILIYKAETVSGNQTTKYIEIDSLGDIKNQGKQVEGRFDIQVFSKGINSYVSGDKLEKYPGNDDISFIEYPVPAVNKQALIISVTFLDDFYKEKSLRNKTYYSWGSTLDAGNKQLPIFKYLREEEVKLLSNLLE